jgi:hypothetical protein
MCIQPRDQHLLDSARAIGIVKESAGCCRIDNVLVGSLCLAAYHERTCIKHTSGQDSEDCLRQCNHIFAACEIGNAVNIARAGRGVEAKLICTGSAEQDITAGAANKRVVAVTPPQNIAASATGYRVCAGIPAQYVIEAGADDILDRYQGVAAKSGHLRSDNCKIDTDAACRIGKAGSIVAIAAIQSVVAGAADEQVIAAKAGQAVISAKARDCVVTGGAAKMIIGRAASEGLVDDLRGCSSSEYLRQLAA